mgnify:CR=1 FL=1
MIRFAYILLFICFSICSYAKLYVYDLNGTSQRQVGKEWETLYKTAELQESDIIRTSDYSSIVILDDSSKKLFSVQSGKPIAVKEVIEKKESHISLLKEAFAGILYSMSKDNNKSVEHYQQRGGVTYRGDNEDRIVAMNITQKCGTNMQSLNDFQSDYPITLRLVDLQTEEYTTQASVGTTLIAEIENRSNTALYVNLMDIDTEGNRTILFPIDEDFNMLHLIVPAYSTVRFADYPIVIYEPIGLDHIVAVAYNKPFNMQHVIDIVPLSGNISDKIGICNHPLRILGTQTARPRL